MIVTDKEYYMDDNLAEKLDLMKKRQEKNWDNLVILDGMEGSGKSTLSWGIGYYFAHKTGKKFTNDNIFFNPDVMMEYASTHEREVIIWDEAAIAMLAGEHQSKIQRKVMKILMMARKKGHLWIFLIPKFFRLNEYIAFDRSIALIHTFSVDLVSRGMFTYCGLDKKNLIFDIYRNTKKRQYNIFNFRGKFTKQYTELIDNDEYEKRKDLAINALFVDGEGSIDALKRCHIALLNCMESMGITQREFSKLVGYSEPVISQWKKALKAEIPKET